MNAGEGGLVVGEADLPCAICRRREITEGNDMIRCKGHPCSIVVHQACYGVPRVPQHDWYCKRCEPHSLCRASKKKCLACPIKEGPLTRTVKNSWIHVTCAMFLDELQFRDERQRDVVDDTSLKSSRGGKAACCICNSRGQHDQAQAGLSVRCSFGRCTRRLHAECAHQAGLTLLDFDVQDLPPQPKAIACPQHRAKLEKMRGTGEEHQQILQHAAAATGSDRNRGARRKSSSSGSSGSSSGSAVGYAAAARTGGQKHRRVSEGKIAAAANVSGAIRGGGGSGTPGVKRGRGRPRKTTPKTPTTPKTAAAPSPSAPSSNTEKRRSARVSSRGNTDARRGPVSAAASGPAPTAAGAADGSKRAKRMSGDSTASLPDIRRAGAATVVSGASSSSKRGRGQGKKGRKIDLDKPTRVEHEELQAALFGDGKDLASKMVSLQSRQAVADFRESLEHFSYDETHSTILRTAALQANTRELVQEVQTLTNERDALLASIEDVKSDIKDMCDASPLLYNPLEKQPPASSSSPSASGYGSGADSHSRGRGRPRQHKKRNSSSGRGAGDGADNNTARSTDAVELQNMQSLALSVLSVLAPRDAVPPTMWNVERVLAAADSAVQSAPVHEAREAVAAAIRTATSAEPTVAPAAPQ